MAEVTGLRNNALPYPVYGVPFGVTFPLLDADGDPISPSSPDSEVSKNGDTFADCTNEATEIATSSGICYLLLTAAEMTADVVTVQIKSTGAKTTVLTLYPRKLPVLSTGTCQGSNDTGDIQLASGDSAVDDTYNGCLCVAVIDSVTEARVINDYVGSTKVGEVSPAWNTAQPDSNDTYTIYLPEGRQVPTANTTWWNSLATVALPLAPTTAGRTLDVSATGEAGIDWANVGSPTTSLALTGTTIASTQKVDVETIKTQAVTCAAGVTFNTNVGTTQPINFTGTGSSALAKIDVIDWSSTAVPAPNQTGVPKVDVTFTAGEIIVTDNGGAFLVGGFTTAGLAELINAFADDSGTAQAGAAGTITLQSGASATNSYYNGAVVCLTGGTGAGQSRKITGYVGSTKVATVDSNWATNPDNTSTYFVIGRIA